MNKSNRIIATSTFAALALLTIGSAQAYSDGSDFNRVNEHYAVGQGPEWVNPYVPYAAADFNGTSPAESADVQLAGIVADYKTNDFRWVNILIREPSADVMFNRHVATYTREMFDRGGWFNPYMSESHYTAPNVMLAVDTGNGFTSTRI